MIVFDYDDYKYYQKCFSYSSPKPNDNRTDLRYYILPNRQKVMLNTSIDIPTQYLIKADFPKMKLLETSRQILDNIDKNIENLNYVKQHKRHILEQYDTIFNNLKTIKFRQNNVQ
jgi:hypothetical protein